MLHEGKIPSLKIDEVKKSQRRGKDFELYTFRQFADNIEHLLHPHRHDHFALFFLTKGTGSHLVDFKEYKLEPNTLFLIAPGQVHAWKDFRNLQGYALLFTREYFTLTLQFKELRSYLLDNIIYQKPWFSLDDKAFKQLQNALASMDSEQSNQNSYAENVIRSYINIILFHVLRLYNSSIPLKFSQDRAFQLVNEFAVSVNRNFRTVQSVAEYAQLLRITPGYLNTICKKYKAKSAGQLIHDRIVIEAKRLLAHSDDTVAQIAYNLNFQDNSYFGRFFKKYTRKTPAQFRESVKAELLKKSKA